MFDSISFENYRSIRKLHVDLKPINVLFGPNGSGKSTFISGIDLLSRTLRMGLRDSVRHAGGITSLRSFSLSREQLTTVVVQRGSLEYQRYFEFQERDGATGHEALSFRDGEQSRVIFDSLPHQLWGRQLSSSPIATLPGRFSAPSMWELAVETDLWSGGVNLDLEDLIHFQIELEGTAIVNCRRLNIDRLADSGSKSQDGTELGPHGEGLWNVLRNLRDTYSSRNAFQAIEGFLQVAFPKFKEFTFQTTGQHVSCSVRESGYDATFPVGMAHDGLFQLTYCLCLLFLSGHRNSLVVLDEPDLSLHPWALTVLADAIKEATSKWNRQVILATHSPTLLSEFKEEEILLMQSGENGVTATRVSDIQEDRDLLDRYDLGSLYQMNIIGKQGDKPLYTEVDATE